MNHGPNIISSLRTMLLSLLVAGSIRGSAQADDIYVPSYGSYFIHCERSLMFSSFKIKDLTVTEAIEVFRAQSRELNRRHQGVNVVIKAPEGFAGLENRVTLDLGVTTCVDVLRTLSRAAGLRCRVDTYAVYLCPLSEPEEMKMKILKVPPDMRWMSGR